MTGSPVLGEEQATMGIASAVFQFSFSEPQDPAHATSRLLSHLSPRFLGPKAIALHHRKEWRDLPGSIDAHIPWLDRASMPLFDGEEETPELGLTRLRAPRAYVNAHPATVAREVGRFVANAQRQMLDWGTLILWGLTNLWYLSPEGALRRDWFLRERMGWTNATTYEQLVEVRLQFWWGAEPATDLSVCFVSRVWSEFADPPPHNEWEEWPTKLDLRAAKANAEALAEVIASYLTTTEGGLSEWRCDRERSPAIERMVVRELEGRLGPASGMHAWP